MDTLEGGPLVNEGLGYIELIDIHVEVVLSVGDGGFQHLFDDSSAGLRGELEDRKCFGNVLSTDEIHDNPYFARSNADILSYCFCFHS